MNKDENVLESIGLDVLRQGREEAKESETGDDYIDAEQDDEYYPPSDSSEMQKFENSASTMIDADQQQSSLENTFTNAPKEAIAEKENRLSKWQKFLFDRKMGKLNRQQALKISQSLYEHEFEAVMQKLTLSLDMEKKRTLAQYLRSTKSLQRELQQLDVEACLSLTQSLMDIRTQVYKAQSHNEQVINNMLREGVINEKQAGQEHQMNENLCKRNLEGAVLTLDQMWENHKKLLEQTLKVSIDTLLINGKL